MCMRTYARWEIDVMDVVEDWGLDYHLGQAVGCIADAARVEDMSAYLAGLEKARDYLDRKIAIVAAWESSGKERTADPLEMPAPAVMEGSGTAEPHSEVLSLFQNETRVRSDD